MGRKTSVFLLVWTTAFFLPALLGMPDCYLDILQENIPYCHFSNWLNWDAARCGDNYEGNNETTFRKRALCCSNEQNTIAGCLAECNKTIGEKQEEGQCVDVFPVLSTTTSTESTTKITPQTTSISTIPTTTRSLPTFGNIETTTTSTPVTSTTATRTPTTITTTFSATTRTIPQTRSATTNLTTAASTLTTTITSEKTTTSTPVTTTTAKTSRTSTTSPSTQTTSQTTVSTTTTVPTTTKRTSTKTSFSVSSSAISTTNIDRSTPTRLPSSNGMSSEHTELTSFQHTSDNPKLLHTSQSEYYTTTSAQTAVDVTSFPGPTYTHNSTSEKPNEKLHETTITHYSLNKLTVSSDSGQSETCSIGLIQVKRGPYEKFTYCTLAVTSVALFGMIATVWVVATVVIKLKRRNAVNDVSAWD